MLSNASLAGCPRLAGGLRLEKMATPSSAAPLVPMAPLAPPAPLAVLAGARGPVRISSSAAAVLALCDGAHTSEAIVSAIVGGMSGARQEGLGADVRAFLDAARRRGWVEGG